MNNLFAHFVFFLGILTTACATPQYNPTSLSPKQTRNDVNVLRGESVIRQQTDYSCGAAALATLLSYSLGDSVNEAQILQQLSAGLSPKQQLSKKIRGFSLLDLQTVAKKRGHKAMGFYLDAKDLAKLHSPVIVFIKSSGYSHFTVLKAVRNDYVYLADPSLGNTRMSIQQFLTVWQNKQGKGIIFVVERKDRTAVTNQLTVPTD